MKTKTYIEPQVKACKLETSDLLTGSVTGNNGTGWGGVDEGGTHDPDANGLTVWEEDLDWPETDIDVFEE